MGSNIPQRQNETRSLTRLAAYSRHYTLAKRFQFIRVGFVALLAIASPLLFLLTDKLAEPLAVLSAVTLLAEVAVKARESNLVAKGAAVQECFDSYVLDLPWNEYLVGDEPRHELVNDAAAKFKGDRQYHKDWYAMTADISPPYDVLICQHENLLWDSRLRKSFAIAIFGVLLCWIVLETVLGLVQDVSLADFLLVFILPVLPGLLSGIDLGFANWRTADGRDQLDKMWKRLWTASLADPASVTPTELRQLQDAIYVSRVRAVLVPNWLHKFKRKNYETDARVGLENCRTELLDAGRLSALGG